MLSPIGYYLQQKTGAKSEFGMLQAVFRNSLLIFVKEFFIRVREYQLGLEMAEGSLQLLDGNRKLLTEKEYADWTRQLMLMRLEMLDRLNEWAEYIEYFEGLSALHDDRYISLGYFAGNESEVHRPYIMRREKEGFYVHFLYFADYRYQIICRKYARQQQGRPVEHQKRHQRDRLTDEELIRRADEYFERYDIDMRDPQ